MTDLRQISKPEISNPKPEEVTLTAAESHRLIGICIELISLCSKVTGKFDPSMGTMIAFARDEALGEAVGLNL